MRNTTLFLSIVLLLTSCGSFSEAGKVFRNEKITNTDEFLVKKEPLVIPPNYGELPKPGSMKKREIDEESKIKTLLKKEKNIETNSSNESSSIENSILNKIKK